MRVLLIGTGGVGEAIATMAQKRDPHAEWLESMVLADYNRERAQSVARKTGEPSRFVSEHIDASDTGALAALMRRHKTDLVLNGCDPIYNEPIFETAFQCNNLYMDMAMSLARKHPDDPFHKCGRKLGDDQFDQDQAWREKGLLAVVGAGVEPGMSDVFARYAEKHLFDSIEEVGIRDGANLQVDGYDIAFGFSIWTTIEECLNPPIIWEKETGWYTTQPFSDPEIFHLPEGIGPVEMVNVEHEEVVLIPRYIGKGLKKVTFKFGLGRDFIQALKYLRALNLDRKDVMVQVGTETITPRDFVAKVAPDPAETGKHMQGKTCAGTWVKGTKEGLQRQVYLYQVADNQSCLKTFDSQAVVSQTAFNPVIMMELLAKKIWKESGVCGPEAFDPDPFVSLMRAYGFPGGLMEMDSEYKRKKDEAAFMQPLQA